MKRETKLAKMAALLGIEMPKEPTRDEIEEGVLNSREAEAVIAFLDERLVGRQPDASP